MKKFRISLLALLLLFITACTSMGNNLNKENITNITAPDKRFYLTGVWKEAEVYDLHGTSNQDVQDDGSDEIFLSKSVLKIDNNYVLNPRIESRFVNFNNYISSKVTEMPTDFDYDLDTVTIVEFSNNLAYSQEFVRINVNKLLAINLGKLIVYEKVEDVSAEQEEAKFLDVQAIVRGDETSVHNEFGLAISFRKRDIDSQDQINYDYYTYYMKKNEEDDRAKILKVRDIIVPKSTGLWTVTTSINQSEEGFRNFTLSANPTFIDQREKINNISDTIYRRIDYVNNDFVAVTNFDYLSNSISQTYNIFNMSTLANNEPLKISSIAGNSGNNILLTKFQENMNLLTTNNQIDLLPATPDPTNIGMERTGNNWQYISNININDAKTGQKVSTEFTLNITPVLSLANTENRQFTWREIIARRPGAIDATVSPDKKYILIQTNNSLEFYPIYYNFIGTSPLFTIQNVDGYEIVMTNWTSQESIKSVFREYDKLNKLNSYIIYP